MTINFIVNYWWKMLSNKKINTSPPSLNRICALHAASRSYASLGFIAFKSLEGFPLIICNTVLLLAFKKYYIFIVLKYFSICE